MKTEQRIQRRNLVRAAILITNGTPLAPTLHERQLLARFVQGSLTIDQVLALREDQDSASMKPGIPAIITTSS
jgi:hypothetical protein